MDGVALLVEAEAAGLTVHADGDRLVVRGPKRLELLARKLVSRKLEILIALATRQGQNQKVAGNTIGENAPKTGVLFPLPPIHSVETHLPDWPAELVAWANCLVPDDLPKQFQLRQGVEVIDREKFLRWIHADIARGPAGPRGASGALVSDLRHLQRILSGLVDVSTNIR